MSLNRQPREDLMREATAYPRRLLLDHPSCQAIFVGLRAQGGWSVYFGEDPVYQFNAQCKLRRVHFEQRNYAAEQGKLLKLSRQRVTNLSSRDQNSGGRIELARIHEEQDEQRVLQDCHNRMEALRHWIERGAVRVANQFPKDGELVGEFAELLDGLSSGIVIADAGGV